ncbi:hypothetical protein Avbf_15585 [Armadillidium vulgare]|nr:hypothetical protein Avbf_15585 [Armadillidium vulgare]
MQRPCSGILMTISICTLWIILTLLMHYALVQIDTGCALQLAPLSRFG